MSSHASHNAPHTLIIAEHEMPTRLGLHAILAAQPYLHLPPPAATAAELLVAVDRFRPDLVLMGLWFPDQDGIDLCRTLLSRYPTLRIRFIANAVNEHLLLHAGQAGALGLIPKGTSRAQILGIVSQTLAGEPTFDHDLMSTVLKRIGNQDAPPQALLAQLSPRHQQMLPLLSAGLTNKEIGTHLSLSEHTVKNYLADLFDRLHMSRRSQVAAWFISQTSRLLPSAPPSPNTENIWRRTQPLTYKQEDSLYAHHTAH